MDGFLQMSSSELQDMMRRLGSNSEDRSRFTAALSCLKSANETGELGTLAVLHIVKGSFTGIFNKYKKTSIQVELLII